MKHIATRLAARLAAVSAALLLAATPALAAGADHKHDHGKDHQPRHGGVMVVVGHIDYELVAKPDRLVVFVSDHGEPLSTTGATAKLTLLTGKDKATADLRPAAPNRLEATGSFKLQPGTVAVATVTLAGKKAAAVRFVVK
jgi:hypothetical protein